MLVDERPHELIHGLEIVGPRGYIPVGHLQDVMTGSCLCLCRGG